MRTEALPTAVISASEAMRYAHTLWGGLPVIEVHLSNIYQRDEFRQQSYVSKAAEGIICGLGGLGYELALEALAQRLGTLKEA